MFLEDEFRVYILSMWDMYAGSRLDVRTVDTPVVVQICLLSAFSHIFCLVWMNLVVGFSLMF